MYKKGIVYVVKEKKDTVERNEWGKATTKYLVSQDLW